MEERGETNNSLDDLTMEGFVQKGKMIYRPCFGGPDIPVAIVGEDGVPYEIVFGGEPRPFHPQRY
jgi:hypothetical protein